MIAVACVLAYSNTFGVPFLFDDEDAVVGNATIRHLWPIWAALRPPHNGSPVDGRPVANLSLAVSFALSGLGPWGYHAVNLLIHICRGGRAVCDDPADAFVAAHPGAARSGRNGAGRLDRAHLGRPSAANRVGDVRQSTGRIARLALLSADALLFDSRRRLARPAVWYAAAVFAARWAWPRRR